MKRKRNALYDSRSTPAAFLRQSLVVLLLWSGGKLTASAESLAKMTLAEQNIRDQIKKLEATDQVQTGPGVVSIAGIEAGGIAWDHRPPPPPDPVNPAIVGWWGYNNPNTDGSKNEINVKIDSNGHVAAEFASGEKKVSFDGRADGDSYELWTHQGQKKWLLYGKYLGRPTDWMKCIVLCYGTPTNDVTEQLNFTNVRIADGMTTLFKDKDGIWQIEYQYYGTTHIYRKVLSKPDAPPENKSKPTQPVEGNGSQPVNESQ